MKEKRIEKYRIYGIKIIQNKKIKKKQKTE